MTTIQNSLSPSASYTLLTVDTNSVSVAPTSDPSRIAVEVSGESSFVVTLNGDSSSASGLDAADLLNSLEDGASLSQTILTIYSAEGDPADQGTTGTLLSASA